MAGNFVDPGLVETSAAQPNIKQASGFVDPGEPEEAQEEAREFRKASYGEGLLQQLGQGVTLGFSDEISSAMAALAASIKDGHNFTEAYNQILTDMRGQQDEFSEENPGTALAANVAGGLLTGGAGAAKVLGTNALKTAPKLAKFAVGGAVPGSIAGVGFSDPDPEMSVVDSAKDRAAGGAKGASIGAVTGVALPVAGGLAVKGVQKSAKAVDNAFRGAPTRAARKISEAFDFDEVSAAQALRKKEVLGKDATLIDLGGKNVVGLAEEVANKPGRAANKAEKVLLGRLRESRDRIKGVITKNLSSKADDLETAKDEILTRMREESKPLYDAALSKEIANTDSLKSLLNNPKVKPLVKKAIAEARADVDLPEHLKARLALENIADEPDMVVWDYIKRQLDDKIGVLQRAGKGNSSRVLTGIKKRITSELDTQNPDYSKARNVWSGAQRQLEALEEGQKIFRDAKQGGGSISNKFDSLPEDQQELFRLGAGHEMLNIIRNTDDTLEGVAKASMLSKLFGSENKKAAVKAIVKSPKDFREFQRSVQAEAKFRNNSSKVLANSATSRRIAQRDEGKTEDLIGEVSEILKGRLQRAGAAVKRLAGDTVTDDNLDKELSKRLFTTDKKEIAETLRLMRENGHLLPKWVRNVNKLAPKPMRQWLQRKDNKEKLLNFLSGAGGSQGGRISGDVSLSQ